MHMRQPSEFSLVQEGTIHIRQTTNNETDRLPGGKLVNCETGDGTGECRFPDKCGGIVYNRTLEQDLCYGYGFSTEVKCCLIRNCVVPEGRGYCRRVDNGCEDGKFVVGTQDPATGQWPCIGGDDVLCCVKNASLTNGTSAVSSTSTISTGSMSTGMSSGNSGHHSTTSTAVGAAAGAVLAFSVFVGLFLYFQRQKKKGKEGANLNSRRSQEAVNELGGKSIQNALQDPDKEFFAPSGNQIARTIPRPNGQVRAELVDGAVFEMDGNEIPTSKPEDTEISPQTPASVTARKLRVRDPTQESWLSTGGGSANSSVTHINIAPAETDQILEEKNE